MFVLGTQYLRGASPERDQWERDLENIKKMGFNTVRAWLVWNAIERAEGRIDYDYLSEFLNLVKKYELEVGLLFHMHACPAWAVQKYSKYFYVDENSLPFEPAVRPNTPGGGWPGLCFDHPEVREMEHRFIENVIKETKKYDCVSFYEPMNEPHQWIDLKKSPCGIFCYCDASVKRFREWLAEKYGDIGSLNNAWGHFYESFDEIRPPRWNISYADYIDFRLFNVDNIAREINYRAEIIKKYDTKPVIAHAWGGGAVTCPQLGGMAFDDWKNAAVMDKWGYSAFPKSAEDCSALGLGCDATRCAANGKDFWQSELTAGLNGVRLDVAGRVDDKTFDNFSLETIRHGAKGLLYWQYRKERFGAEWGGFSMTDYDGGPTNLSVRAGKLASAIKKCEDALCEGKQRKAEVALVFSIRSYFASWLSNDKKDNRFPIDSMNGYYRMFWEENIPVDIIHEDVPCELSDYKLIVVPSPFAVSAELSERLKEYVKNGGIIISDPFYGAFESDFKLSYKVPGHGFDEIFGCREYDMNLGRTVSVVRDGKKYTLRGSKQLEILTATTGDVICRSDDGTALMISGKYGKGEAIIAAVNLGLCYSKRTLIGDDFVSSDAQQSEDIAKLLVLELAERAGVSKNITDAPDVKVSVIGHDEKNEDIVILINSRSAESSGKLCGVGVWSDCESLYGEAKCAVKDGEFSFTVGPNESAIIRLLR